MILECTDPLSRNNGGERAVSWLGCSPVLTSVIPCCSHTKACNYYGWLAHVSTKPRESVVSCGPEVCIKTTETPLPGQRCAPEHPNDKTASPSPSIV